MRHPYKEKIVINKDFLNIEDFVKEIPYIFRESGNTIYESRNTIKTFEVDGVNLNVKSFKKPHFINQFVYATFRESKAKRSYTYAQKLLERGINTPTPIAYMEYTKPCMLKYSLYICEHIEVDDQMRVLQKGTFEEHKELLTQFAKFTARLHELKVFHLDYSSGNILFKKENNKYSFYLVDLNRMEFDKYVDIKRSAHNFRRLWGSDEMITYFAKEYAIARNFDVEYFVSLVLKYRAQFWKNFNRQYPDVRPYWGEERIKIGYDAKRAIHNFTGLGNYSRFVISNMASLYPQNSYYLYTPTLATEKIQTELKNFDNVTQIVKEGVSPFWRTIGILKDIKEQNIDIYHGLSNELPVGIYKTKTKSVVTIHDLIFRIHPEFYQMIDRQIYDAKAKYACNNADRIVAVSECTKRDIVKIYDIDPNKIDVVYQGCFSIYSKQASAPLKKEVKELYKLPDKYLLSVGSIEERKNILLVVKALKQIPDIHFVAIGKKRAYAETVQEYAKNNGLEDRVHMFSGVPMEHLPAIFQQACLFIYPSIYEGFGIPLLEAQNSGLPIIAATGSCLEEAGGPHSIYINPSDENELAMQIKRVLSDDELRSSMINAGKEFVKKFESEKCMEALNNVYAQLLGE